MTKHTDNTQPPEQTFDEEPIKSPCIRNCCLNRKDICMGCFRHLDEITGWGQATNERKKQILKLASERKKNYKIIIPFESRLQ